jgi:hypothetical protein
MTVEILKLASISISISISRQQAARSRQQAAGSRQQAAGPARNTHWWQKAASSKNLERIASCLIHMI